MDYVFEKDGKSQRNVNTEITETLRPNDANCLESVEKSVKEIKMSALDNRDTIRYDFFKVLFSIYQGIEFNEETSQPIFETIGDEVTYNTLFVYGFLKLVDVE